MKKINLVVLLFLFSLVVYSFTGCKKTPEVSSKLSINSTNTHNWKDNEDLLKLDFEKEQQNVDEGHTPWKLDAHHVILEYAKDIDSLKDVISIDTFIEEIKQEDGSIQRAYKIQGKTIIVEVFQPVKKGTEGIYAVKRYLIE